MMVVRECLVLLVDVGYTMQPRLDVIFKSLSVFGQRKLFFHKNDALGVVFFGAKETQNILSQEIGGYDNIVVAREIQVVDNDVSDMFDRPPKGSGPADFLDAVVVGMDMLVRRVEPTKKGMKRLLLISDAQSPIREPDQGMLQDQVDMIGDRLEEHGVTLDVLKVSTIDSMPNPSGRPENELFLEKLVARSQGELEQLSNDLAIMAAITPQVSPATIYRGDLEVTPMMRVKVWVYKKVSQERIPSLKKFSDKAPVDDPFATREVKMDVEYKSISDPSMWIPPEQRIQAFKYGANNIPIDPTVKEAVRLKPEKGLKLIGFTDASNVPRHYYMKDTKLFIPEPSNSKSSLAVSGLVRAMKKTNLVGIVRCVWRQGQANVVVGVLSPNPAAIDGIADSFYFNELPFAEDIREFPFHSFSNGPASQQPSPCQEAAADHLVQTLDLSPADGDEILQPEKTCNPILLRFYSFLHAKMLDPEAAVPSLYEPLRKIMEPDFQLMMPTAELAIEKFCDQFTLIAKIRKGSEDHKFWKEGLADGAQVKAADERLESEISFESLSGKKVEEVRLINPVQDFEALLARRDGDQFVPIALRGMRRVIHELLESAYKGNTYEKAFSCIVALRAGCVKEEEPSEFNTFLQELASKCRGKRLADFWDRMVSKAMTLISSDETSASDVSGEAAQAFLTSQRGLESEANPAEEIDEMEALLGEAM